MMKEIQLQIDPNNNNNNNNNDDDIHHHNHDNDHDDEQGEASSSSSSISPPEIVSVTPALDGSPNMKTTTINAKHYSILFQNDMARMGTQIKDVSTLRTESEHNTMLHIAASVGQLNFIDYYYSNNNYLQQTTTTPNSKLDLPLHAAARACQFGAVEKLVSKVDHPCRTLMLEARNEDENTALHIALENYQKEMALFLFDNCRNTYYCLNSQGISPLYLAIKAEFWDLVTAMLSQPPNDEAQEALPSLLKGKSIVHAAISARKQDILEEMVRKYGFELMYKIRDEKGMTPLSYAAYIGFHAWVKYMINTKQLKNQAYVVDNKGWFPIHWACIGGHMGVVKLFIGSYPENMMGLLNNKGQNILHVAALNGKTEVVNYILKQQPKLEGMINMKDEDGNTAFHLACKKKHPRVVYNLTLDDRVRLKAQNKDGLTALDISEEYADFPSFEERLTWLFLRCAGVPNAPQEVHKFDTGGINNEEINDNLSPPNKVTLFQRKYLLNKKPPERINTLLVVSILVATVTFTSGFTVPGGYKNNSPGEGMATLAHKVAFQLFVITNTMALHSSILASVTLIWAHLDDLRLTALSLRFALPLLGTSLTMMSVAFMVGLYVVLHDVIFWLSIVALVMGGVFLVTLLIFFIPLYSPSTSFIRNNFLRRYVFRVPFTLMLLACDSKGKDHFVTMYM